MITQQMSGDSDCYKTSTLNAEAGLLSGGTGLSSIDSKTQAEGITIVCRRFELRPRESGLRPGRRPQKHNIDSVRTDRSGSRARSNPPPGLQKNV